MKPCGSLSIFLNPKEGKGKWRLSGRALNFCDMHDLGFSGLPWTFDNKQSENRNVRVRLDRAVANDDWCDLFDQASVEHLTSPCSDHCPVLLRLSPSPDARRKAKILRYEIMWERDESLGDVILDAWSLEGGRSSLSAIASSLEGVMQLLHDWSREKFGSVREKLQDLRNQLAVLSGLTDRES